MEPNKLENQIKDKLNSREIQPSLQAWDRLDAMLSVAEEKKTRPSFGWLYIAASVLVFVSLGLFFFTQNSVEVKPENTVVGRENRKDFKKQDIIPVSKKVYKDVYTMDELKNPLLGKSQSNQSAITKSDKSFNQNNQTLTNKNQQSINHDKEIEYQKSTNLALKELPKIIDNIKAVNPKDNIIPSDEQLLAGLDKTVKQSSDKDLVIKVNPKSLLSQVDGELELTFREKVIKSVARNYKEVKVALANRNNE